MICYFRFRGYFVNKVEIIYAELVSFAFRRVVKQLKPNKMTVRERIYFI